MNSDDPHEFADCRSPHSNFLYFYPFSFSFKKRKLACFKLKHVYQIQMISKASLDEKNDVFCCTVLYLLRGRLSRKKIIRLADPESKKACQRICYLFESVSCFMIVCNLCGSPQDVLKINYAHCTQKMGTFERATAT